MKLINHSDRMQKIGKKQTVEECEKREIVLGTQVYGINFVGKKERERNRGDFYIILETWRMDRETILVPSPPGR